MKCMAIEQTRQWLEQTVIGENFCPFAKREWDKQSIRYHVIEASGFQPVLEDLLAECQLLDNTPDMETSLLILPHGFAGFVDFLTLLKTAERLLALEGYEGIYQIASFHPQYCFADADEADAANYTNRSPYAMLHLLREASLEKAIAAYDGDIEQVPQRNIEHARALGVQYFQARLQGLSVQFT